MAARGPYRRDSLQFKIQICSDVCSGRLGRREAHLPVNLRHMWPGQFDHGDLDREDATASTAAEYEAHIAALVLFNVCNR